MDHSSTTVAKSPSSSTIEYAHSCTQFFERSRDVKYRDSLQEVHPDGGDEFLANYKLTVSSYPSFPTSLPVQQPHFAFEESHYSATWDLSRRLEWT